MSVLAKACPIRERTANGVSVGRCWHHLPDGHTCERHGDVTAAVAKYIETGKLTDESELGARVKP